MGKTVGGGGLGGGGAGGGAGSNAGNGGGGSRSGGKSNGSSGNGAGSQAAQKASQGNLPAGTVTQGAGTVTGREAAAPSAGRVVSANPNNAETQNVERSASNYGGEGATPYIADPSLGQIFGALMNLAPMAGTFNNVAGVVNNLSDGTAGFDKPYDGGAFGAALDKARGVSPGAVTGASNPNLGGNRARSTVGAQAGAPVAGYGRVDDGSEQSLGDAFNQIISTPGVWPPVRASKGI